MEQRSVVAWLTVLTIATTISSSEVAPFGVQSSEKVTFTSTDTCSPRDQANLLTQPGIRCKPRPTLLELELPVMPGGSGSVFQLIPGHITVDRCSGSCHLPSKSCLPTRVTNISVEVMAIQTTYTSGPWNTLCSTVQVEKHLDCECGCRVKSSDCTSTQYYDPANCKCQCLAYTAKLECLASGKLWDDSSCSCMCPPRLWKPCSTGFTYDYRQTCDCVRTYAMASTGLTVIVAVASMALLGISAYVFQIKRKQDVVSRRYTNYYNDL